MGGGPSWAAPFDPDFGVMPRASQRRSGLLAASRSRLLNEKTATSERWGWPFCLLWRTPLVVVMVIVNAG